jgi:hypothetical protein
LDFDCITICSPKNIYVSFTLKKHSLPFFANNGGWGFSHNLLARSIYIHTMRSHIFNTNFGWISQRVCI